MGKDLFITTPRPLYSNKNNLDEEFALYTGFGKILNNDDKEVNVIDIIIFKMDKTSGKLNSNRLKYTPPRSENENHAELFKMILAHNENEYQRLLIRIKEINEYPKSESADKISKYLDEVKFRFGEWYKKNKLALPDGENRTKLKNTKGENIRVTKKLILTPNKREMLNSKIVAEIKDFIYGGKGTQEQAFKKLSKQSKKIFGRQLTPKQIEGRYSRNKKKHL